MDGYGRRDVNGKANAGLTLGIIGTALGAWALFGNRRSAGVLGTGAGLMGDGSKNLKTSIIEMSQREMQLFNAFKEASAKNPSLTYDEFIKTMK